MDSLSPFALLLTQSLAGQLREVVELMQDGPAVALEQQMAAVEVH